MKRIKYSIIIGFSAKLLLFYVLAYECGHVRGFYYMYDTFSENVRIVTIFLGLSLVRPVMDCYLLNAGKWGLWTTVAVDFVIVLYILKLVYVIPFTEWTTMFILALGISLVAMIADIIAERSCILREM